MTLLFSCFYVLVNFFFVCTLCTIFIINICGLTRLNISLTKTNDRVFQDIGLLTVNILSKLVTKRFLEKDHPHCSLNNIWQAVICNACILAIDKLLCGNYTASRRFYLAFAYVPVYGWPMYTAIAMCIDRHSVHIAQDVLGLRNNAEWQSTVCTMHRPKCSSYNKDFNSRFKTSSVQIHIHNLQS